MERYKPWQVINELDFHENTLVLELSQRSQELPKRILASEDWTTHLLDDFALIAACEGGASNVTAASLDYEEFSDAWNIRVARNENLSPAQRAQLTAIVNLMNGYKERGNASGP